MLMKKFAKDRNFASLAAQYVPIKISTDSEEFQELYRAYRPEGGGIPYLFVIRADGEKLYAGTGRIKDAELLLMLTQSLAKSGRVYNERQLRSLTEALAKAQKFYDENDFDIAYRIFNSNRSLGISAEPDSFAEPAMNASQLLAEMDKAGIQAIAGIEKILEDQQELDDPSDVALKFVDAERQFGSSPDLKKKIRDLHRKIRSNKVVSALVTDAQKVFKLQRSRSPNRIELLQGLAEKHQDNQVGAKALQIIDESKVADSKTDQKRTTVENKKPDAKSIGEESDFRVWIDSTGKHTTRAVLIERNESTIRLRREDGSETTVSIDSLSLADQLFLDSLDDQQ